MRRVRGGRNKDRSLSVNMAVLVREDWLTYLLVFAFALFGILIGILLRKVATTTVILLAVIFLSLLITGLISAWAINRRTDNLEFLFFQEGLKEQYNAFSLLITELELNLNVEHGSLVSTANWQLVKNELAFFPAYIYTELSYCYNRLAELGGLDIIEYRQVIIEELAVPTLISKLRDWQQKIKRQLPYLD
ncbi:MAG: hypothetical protein ACOWWO_06220 [Peptococcaceae bacterium]